MKEVAGTPPELDDVVLQLITPRIGRSAPSAVDWERRELMETRGGEVAIWSSGDGPPVLLVHGWSSTHTDMDAFVGPLLERGYRVVALDLPAHGMSSGATATMPEISAAIVDVGSRFGPLAGLVGHSFGCPSSATALASGLSADRVVLVATPAYYETLVRATAIEAGVDPLELMAAFAARGVDVSSLDLPKIAATLDVPALIFHSADDRIVDISFGEAVAAAWRGSTFVRLAGLGHSRILRDAGVVSRSVDFIAGRAN